MLCCIVFLHQVSSLEFPFQDESVKELFRKIKTADYEDPKNASNEFKSFIKLMLNPKPEARTSWLELCKHPWMTNKPLPEYEFIFNNIKNWNENSYLELCSKIGNESSCFEFIDLVLQKYIGGLINQDEHTNMEVFTFTNNNINPFTNFENIISNVEEFKGHSKAEVETKYFKAVCLLSNLDKETNLCLMVFYKLNGDNDSYYNWIKTISNLI